MPAVTLCDDHFEVVSSLKYPWNLITTGGFVEEITTIAETREAFAQVRYLWRGHDMQLFPRGRLSDAMSSLGVASAELRIEDAQKLCIWSPMSLGRFSTLVRTSDRRW